MEHLSIGNLLCDLAPADGGRVCYLLTPMPLPAEWLERQAVLRQCSLAALSGMDWNADLTPWPAPRAFRGEPDFGGLAAPFLDNLRAVVLPRVESALRLSAPRRSLAGISLSGLFAVWAWLQCDDFLNVASVSGSFWYDGFTRWMAGQDTQRIFPATPRAYLSLGDKEPLQRNQRFASVGDATRQVCRLLADRGADVTFEWNPGGHHADTLPRLEKALTAIL